MSISAMSSDVDRVTMTMYSSIKPPGDSGGSGGSNGAPGGTAGGRMRLNSSCARTRVPTPRVKDPVAAQKGAHSPPAIRCRVHSIISSVTFVPLMINDVSCRRRTWWPTVHRSRYSVGRASTEMPRAVLNSLERMHRQ